MTTATHHGGCPVNLVTSGMTINAFRNYFYLWGGATLKKISSQIKFRFRKRIY